METGHIVILLLFGAFIAYLIYYTLTHKDKEEEKKEVIKPSLDGLPSVPDPNPGYIRGAKFGRKNQLHRLAAWTRLYHRRIYSENDKTGTMQLAFRQACKQIGAIDTYGLFLSVKNVLEENPIFIGELAVDKKDETKGFLVTGRPGSGKTQLLSQVIETLYGNAKVVIHDYKADYLQAFYDPDGFDIVFNPLDQRCVKWDVFEGVQGEWDIESMATALIPSPPGSVDQHWTDAARNVLIGAMTYLKVNHNASNNELVKLISDIPQLVKTITENSMRGSAHLIGYPDSKEAQSVLSTFVRYTNCLKYLPDTSTAGDGVMTFKIRNWLSMPIPGALFVTNYQRTQDALRPLLSLFLEVVIRTVLSQKDDLSRRVYFILDEFGQLNRVPSISSLITQGRSKGASSWIGIQDLAQIETKYSKSIRQSITNSLSNHIILNVIDAETADIFSREIGEVTRLKTDYTKGTSEGYQSDGDSSSNYTSSQRTSQVTERLILPSEILAMKDLQCIVKMINRDVLATELPIIDYKAQSEAFVLDERFTFASKQAAETAGETENKIEREEGADEIKD